MSTEPISSSTVPSHDPASEKGIQGAGGEHQGRKFSHGAQAVLALLRLLTFAAALSAFVVMITDSQSTLTILGVRYAKYHYSPAFTYFVVATCVVFVYALIAAIITPFARLRFIASVLFLLDLLASYLLLSAVGAACAVAWIGKKGNDHSGWLPICGTFDRFCDHVVGAVAIGAVGFAFIALSAIIQAHQLIHSYRH